MKTTLIILMLITIKAHAQDSWQFKSAEDNFTVTGGETLMIGDTQIANKKAFDSFLKLLLKGNRGDCPTLGEPALTVEAKTASATVTKKFYPTEGAIEANGKCATLDYDTGWSLPFHRSWFTNEPEGKIAIGATMTFKSPELSFTITKKDNDWVGTGKGFVPDLLRMADFARAAESFKVERMYSKKAKENSRSNFTMTTNGTPTKFYHINGLWAVEKSHQLLATKDFSMLGRFARNELGDNRSDDMITLGNKQVAVEERIDLLDKMSNVDSHVFKNTLHKILRDPEEDAKLKEQVALFLVDRPSADNIKALMTLLEKGAIGEKAIASKALKRLNPGGPLFNADDASDAHEKLKKWREWYAKYSKASR